ncbi:MAG: hypothetical protein ACREUQ_07385 [Burkholderiales bacterium]
MDPITLAALAVGAFLVYKKRNTAAGSTGTPDSGPTQVASSPPVKADLMAQVQTPPVSSEMSVAATQPLSVQTPLQPVGQWATNGAMSQGSGTMIADDGVMMTAPVSSIAVNPLDFGTTGKQVARTEAIDDGVQFAPVVLAPSTRGMTGNAIEP